MFLMILSQEDIEIKLALFDTLENGRTFASKLPGYQLRKEKIQEYWFEYETLSPSEFSDYEEIPYKGNILPFTKFTFPKSQDVDIFWEEIPSMDIQGQGLLQSQTRVDNYSIPNKELKTYIENRENGYKRVQAILDQLGYGTSRDLAGSEDGEVILFKKNKTRGWFILSCLDPEFVEETLAMSDSQLKEWILNIIKNK